ncbi:MAG: small, acid-soluble spore protein, alpha/beta type [Tissierellia bacterium]|nr:small, acid-soluble spore protein, alpha/beta type [Tissierellia bacterium]
MSKKMSSPNALKALEELKMEIANELSIDNQSNSEKEKKHSVGGMAARNLVAMGQKKLINKE